MYVYYRIDGLELRGVISDGLSFGKEVSNITQGREGASIGGIEEDAHQDSTHVIIEGE